MIEIRHKELTDGLSVGEAYDDLFVDHDIRMNDSYYLWILSLLDAPPGSTLVDVACASGRLVQIARERGIVATGLDISYPGFAKAATETPGAGWVVGDGHGMPLASHSVDYVVSSGSLEHYDVPVQGVREIARILKPNGLAYILLPNVFGLLGNILHVYQTGEVYDDVQPLQRYGTRATWSAMLRQGGLEILRVVRFNDIAFPRTEVDAKRMLARPPRLAKYLIGQLTPVNLINQLVFMCRPSTAGADRSYSTTLPRE